jgi:hypothetical protein
LQHTAVGYAIHHIVSVGWATLYEKHVAGLFGRESTSARVGAAAAEFRNDRGGALLR